MTANTAIVWFRQDLRLSDNPALNHAARTGKVLPVFILDESNGSKPLTGEAGKWWLHQSLTALNEQLGGKLHIFHGDTLTILKTLTQQVGDCTIHWNRCYEPWRIQQDKLIKATLHEAGIHCHSFSGSLLFEPWETLKADNTPYKVFTPFYKKMYLQGQPPRKPVEQHRFHLVTQSYSSSTIEDLALLSNHPWHQKLHKHWQPGELAARNHLNQFIEHYLTSYKEGRDIPGKHCTSRLSPYLHWGELSPNQIWYDVKHAMQNEHSEAFLRQLVWRDFSYSMLYHYPNLPTHNWQPKFDPFPWKSTHTKALTSWQKGLTGYPIIDAGMRELWQTGYMHNRVRMIVGSFLVKNLLQHWQQGQAWFWDCLLDADLANNSASWQWVAGCGADAAPYFRIFNPITQGQKFDSDGAYTRHFVPELKQLPDKYLFNPWEAPASVLSEAGIELGKHYPKPIVDLKLSRVEALEAYEHIKAT